MKDRSRCSFAFSRASSGVSLAVSTVYKEAKGYVCASSSEGWVLRRGAEPLDSYRSTGEFVPASWRENCLREEAISEDTIELVEIGRFGRVEVLTEERRLLHARSQCRPLIVGVDGHLLHNRPERVVADAVRFKELSRRHSARKSETACDMRDARRQ